MKLRHALLISALAIAVAIGTILRLLPRNSPTTNTDALEPNFSENRDDAELTADKIIVADSATILPGQLCEVVYTARQWELRLDLLHARELVASVFWHVARNGDKAIRIDNPPSRTASCGVYENGALLDLHEIRAVGPNSITVTANLQFDHISREHFDYQVNFEATLNETGVVDAGNANTLHWAFNGVPDR